MVNYRFTVAKIVQRGPGTLQPVTPKADILHTYSATSNQETELDTLHSPHSMFII